MVSRRVRVGVGSQRDLEELRSRIVECHRCPRLVRYREAVARTKVARFHDWTYWGRPVPGFGDPDASVLIVGLAPAAHGGNRTGRVFTGDRSGDWLYRALHRAGFSNRPIAVSADDGLRLDDAYIAAAVRCAPPGNRPSVAEFDRCQAYLETEIQLLKNLRVVVTLGGVAMDRFLRAWQATGREAPRPKPQFGHGRRVPLEGVTLIASYHPSQRNTQTGLLSEPMFDAIFAAVREELTRPPSAGPSTTPTKRKR